MKIQSQRHRGMTLIELAIAVSLLAVVGGSVCQLFVQSSRAFADQTLRSNLTARSQAVMNRLVVELATGRFISMTPPIPIASDFIRFERPTSFDGTAAVYGNPIQIDLVPNADGVTSSLRIWEDVAPTGVTPGTGDTQTLIAGNIAATGLSFTRQGAILEVAVTFLTELESSTLPELLTLNTGVKMRNDE